MTHVYTHTSCYTRGLVSTVLYQRTEEYSNMDRSGNLAFSCGPFISTHYLGSTLFMSEEQPLDYYLTTLLNNVVLYGKFISVMMPSKVQEDRLKLQNQQVNFTHKTT